MHQGVVKQEDAELGLLRERTQKNLQANLLVQGCMETSSTQLLPVMPHNARKDKERGMGGSLGSEVEQTNKSFWIKTFIYALNYTTLTSANAKDSSPHSPFSQGSSCMQQTSGTAPSLQQSCFREEEGYGCFLRVPLPCLFLL